MQSPRRQCMSCLEVLAMRSRLVGQPLLVTAVSWLGFYGKHSNCSPQCRKHVSHVIECNGSSEVLAPFSFVEAPFKTDRSPNKSSHRIGHMLLYWKPFFDKLTIKQPFNTYFYSDISDFLSDILLTGLQQFGLRHLQLTCCQKQSSQYGK